MNYVLGSITPWSPSHTKKPSFMVMEMDPDDLLPINLDTYTFDIQYANENNQPKWELDHNIQ